MPWRPGRKACTAHAWVRAGMWMGQGMRAAVEPLSVGENSAPSDRHAFQVTVALEGDGARESDRLLKAAGRRHRSREAAPATSSTTRSPSRRQHVASVGNARGRPAPLSPAGSAMAGSSCASATAHLGDDDRVPPHEPPPLQITFGIAARDLIQTPRPHRSRSQWAGALRPPGHHRTGAAITSGRYRTAHSPVRHPYGGHCGQTRRTARSIAGDATR